jgi:hypothetical protein
MANLYGVANPNPLWAFATPIGGADVACPAGVETTFITVVINPTLNPGIYYAAAVGVVTTLLGAVAPTAITFGLRIGGGSDVIAIAPSFTSFVANTPFIFPLPLYGINALISNPIPPTTLNVTANPAAQGVTIKQGGSLVFAGWVRAPDQ